MYITDLQEDDLEISVKVVIVGNGAVGKSSLIQRYCRGIFTKSYKKTIGVDFLEKHLRISGEDVRLMLWDTAGQEEFDAITKAYYRGAQACVIAFSTTDRSSFESVKRWKKKVEDECGALPMVLVQNKTDLMQEAAIAPDEVERLAREFNMRLYRTSVKEDLNVGAVFQHLAENYVNQVRSYDMTDGVSSSSGSSGSTGSHSPPVIQIGGGIRSAGFRSNGGGGAFALGIGGGYRSFDGYTRSSGFPGGQYCSPQDYLNNPMFESLHQHRKYWPTDRTITLRPLSLKKKSIQRKLVPMGNPLTKNSCKVL